MITGKYNIKIMKPCRRFNLYDSNGGIYHTRIIPEGINTIEASILQPDNYTANVPFKYAKIGEIEQGKEIDLEVPERFRLRPVKVVYNANMTGTPARIFSQHMPATIEVNDRFYQLPAQIRYFILLHEYGHLFYATEWKVDRFALYIFLRQGYNPSQAWHALFDVLGRGDQAKDRIIRLFETLKANDFIN